MSNRDIFQFKWSFTTNIGPFMTFLPLPHCALHHLYTFLTPSGAFQPCTIYMELLNLLRNYYKRGDVRVYEKVVVIKRAFPSLPVNFRNCWNLK